MQQLLVATNNQGKQVEVAKILSGLKNLKLVFPSDVASLKGFNPEETGSTFTENALIKARKFAQVTRIPAIADDSGLEVEALGGKPGVHSKRFFKGSDKERNQQLLTMVRESGKGGKARFVSVVAFVDPKKNIEKTFKGIVEGKLASKPQGNQGFGYDPIFIPAGYDQTFASLGLAIKNQLSHRAKAFKAFKKWFADN